MQRDKPSRNLFRIAMRGDCDHGLGDFYADHFGTGSGAQPKGFAGAEADFADALTRCRLESSARRFSGQSTHPP
jgi:hypothetical protein